jgi:hypothetical protein
MLLWLFLHQTLPRYKISNISTKRFLYFWLPEWSIELGRGCGYGNFNRRIMFLPFTPECVEFYEGSPSVCRPPVKWSVIDVTLRNTEIGYETLYFMLWDEVTDKSCLTGN